jgi:hypothetical protein
MGRSVIAVYKPRPGKHLELADVVNRHWPVLRREGLVTDRPTHIMRAADGTIVEVFEWLSPEAIEQAHLNPEVLKIWEQFGAACEYAPIGSVPEAATLFSEFETLLTTEV